MTVAPCPAKAGFAADEYRQYGGRYRVIPAAIEALAPPAKFACVTAGENGVLARMKGVSLHRRNPDIKISIVNTNGRAMPSPEAFYSR
jgi:hypothetical protein